MDFQEIKNGIINCRNCRELFGFEPVPLQWGEEHARIMIIGQAPSNLGMKSVKPFNDLTGKKLRDWLGVDDETFYNREIFYLTAMGHCFPGKASNGGDKKPPRICSEMWLKNEMQVVKNNLYIILGRTAAEYLFPKRDFVELAFNDQEINGKPAIILSHPSPLNIKWFKDHPDFIEQRIPHLKKLVQQALN